MIAVVFEPRFGSSKVMQTLADAGYPVAGDKFPEWVTEDQKQWNPLGYYEHPNPRKAIAEGIGKAAIKLRIREAMEIPLPADTRFLLCTRDLYLATESQMRSGLVQWGSIEEGIKANGLLYEDAEEEGIMNPHLERHGGTSFEWYVVEHEEWLKDPEKAKRDLLEWAYGV